MFLSASVLCGIVIGDTIYLVSQEMVGVSHAFPIAMSYPILTLALTTFFLGETLVLGRLTGAVVTVVGIILISREQDKSCDGNDPGETRNVPGILLAMMTSLLYAMGATFLQVGVSDTDPVAANFVRVFVGSVALVPVFGTAAWRGMPMPSARATKLIAITGFLGMGIGSLLYVMAVKLAGAAVTSVVGATAPLFAVPISVLFLKEKLGRTASVGIVATVVGVVLVVIS
jgi:drug/metabolite transporter (DMT)-like permease